MLHSAVLSQAKDARIDELNKRKKKVVVRRVRVAAEGNDPDIAALQSDNQRLREREQALVEAVSAIHVFQSPLCKRTHGQY